MVKAADWFNVRQEALRSIVVVGCVLVASAVALYQRESERTLPGDPVALAAQSSRLKQEIERLQMADELPVLWKSWSNVLDLARGWEVELVKLSKQDKGAYSGPAKSWHGAIRGPTRKVLASAHQLQKIAPVQLGMMKAEGGQAVLTLSVIGVER